MMQRILISRACYGFLGSCGPRRRGSASSRRGTVLVTTAGVMVGLIGLGALAVDVGYVFNARTELQRTADASALAAAACLPEQSAATSAAQLAATQNQGEGGPDLDVSNVQFGYWDRDNATFTSSATWGGSTNAVRVTLERSESAGNPLSLFFARLLGNPQADTSASATAIYDQWLCGPFVGINWVEAPGTIETDSYNSDDGAYSSGGHKGSICSDGPVGVHGNALIKGDARAGKGHQPVLTGGATVTRSVGSRLKPLNMPPVDASEAALVNDNHQIPLIPQGHGWRSAVDADGNFLLDGNKTMDLPPGTYYLNDFELAGQAEFSVSGPTTIYLTGNLDRAGGVLVTNSTQKADNLKFLMTGGTARVTSTDDFYGVIYAPNTAVTIDGDSNFFGAVVGKTLLITGTATAHYDETLNLDEIEFPLRIALVD